MKHIINLTIAICLLGICHKSNGQTLKDQDGNTYTIKTMPDNKQWITANLNTNIPGSYCYENAEQYCKKYGRLYTWKSAQEGCKLLGEEWRLPTHEEWKQLAKYYGGIYGDSNDSGRTVYKALLDGGNAGFNALLGGGGEPAADKDARLEAHGFYWTATASDTANAWFCNFGKGSGKLFIQNDGEKPGAFSVRCIKQ